MQQAGLPSTCSRALSLFAYLVAVPTAPRSLTVTRFLTVTVGKVKMKGCISGRGAAPCRAGGRATVGTGTDPNYLAAPWIWAQERWGPCQGSPHPGRQGRRLPQHATAAWRPGGTETPARRPGGLQSRGPGTGRLLRCPAAGTCHTRNSGPHLQSLSLQGLATCGHMGRPLITPLLGQVREGISGQERRCGTSKQDLCPAYPQPPRCLLNTEPELPAVGVTAELGGGLSRSPSSPAPQLVDSHTRQTPRRSSSGGACFPRGVVPFISISRRHTHTKLAATLGARRPARDIAN